MALHLRRVDVYAEYTTVAVGDLLRVINQDRPNDWKRRTQMGMR